MLFIIKKRLSNIFLPANEEGENGIQLTVVTHPCQIWFGTYLANPWKAQGSLGQTVPGLSH